VARPYPRSSICSTGQRHDRAPRVASVARLSTTPKSSFWATHWAELERLDEYLETGDPDAPGHYLAWLVQRVPCYATRLKSRWFDIRSIESFEEAKRRFESGDPYG
jgi:hypothetical protein